MIREINIVKELYKILNSYYSNNYNVSSYYSKSFISFKTDNLDLILQKNTMPNFGYTTCNKKHPIVVNLYKNKEIVKKVFYKSSKIDYDNLKYVNKVLALIEQEIIDRKYL